METDRLLLRRFVPGDLDELAGVFAHDEVWRFPYGRGFTPVETAAFATEGATASLGEAFDTLGLTTVCSLHQAANPPSARVAAGVS